MLRFHLLSFFSGGFHSWKHSKIHSKVFCFCIFHSRILIKAKKKYSRKQKFISRAFFRGSFLFFLRAYKNLKNWFRSKKRDVFYFLLRGAQSSTFQHSYVGFMNYFFLCPHEIQVYIFFFSLTVPTRVLYFGFFAAFFFVVVSAAKNHTSNHIEHSKMKKLKACCKREYLHYDNEPTNIAFFTMT